jgi:hypothetical protein
MDEDLLDGLPDTGFPLTAGGAGRIALRERLAPRDDHRE